jgi:phage/plasmid-associated DNA primase
MSDNFLVNLNELSKSETKGNEGQFKQMVTDGKLTINSKGVAQYQIDSYHRFFTTTNNLDPITTK